MKVTLKIDEMTGDLDVLKSELTAKDLSLTETNASLEKSNREKAELIGKLVQLQSEYDTLAHKNETLLSEKDHWKKAAEDAHSNRLESDRKFKNYKRQTMAMEFTSDASLRKQIQEVRNKQFTLVYLFLLLVFYR